MAAAQQAETPVGVAFAAVLWLGVVTAPIVLREPRVGGVLGHLFTAVCWVMLAILLRHQSVMAILTSLVGSRLAMIVLAWIARPSVEAPAIQARVTSVGAIAAILLGLGLMAFSGWPTMFLLFATTFVVIRAVVWISYSHMGGISIGSLGFVRQSIEVLTLLIAGLPGSFPFVSGY